MHLRTSSFRPSGIATSHQETLADHRGAPVPGTGSARASLRVRFFGHFEFLYGDEFVPLGCNARALFILE